MDTVDQISLEAARRFLHTVVLVDDEADLHPAEEREPSVAPSNIGNSSAEDTAAAEVEPSPSLEEPSESSVPRDTEELDAKTVIDQFSKLGLVCAVIRPSASDVVEDTVCPVAGRTDILILDWWLNGEQGTRSLNIIRRVATDDEAQHRTRLIVIYTGQRDLEGIIQQVAGAIGDSAVVNGTRCVAGPVHVVALAKPETSVDEELTGSVVDFSELPTRVIKEFANAVHGLLRNVALGSFAVIRNNTHRILTRFSKDLDAAYLGQRMLLPYPEDAQQQVTMLIAAELSSVLDDAKVGRFASLEATEAMVEQNMLRSRDVAPLGAMAARNSISSKEMAFRLLKHGVDSSDFVLSSGEKRHAPLWSGQIFAVDDESASRLGRQFAMLMKCKSYYENLVPRLTLGVIIKDVQSSTFYLCMQPPCDSVRLSSDTAFPLLPLNETETNIDFVLKHDDGYFLFKLNLKFSSLRMVNFSPGQVPPGVVQAEQERTVGHWIYRGAGADGSEFRWIGELREGWAHYYANRFATESSRVGVEDSEWVRRLR